MARARRTQGSRDVLLAGVVVYVGCLFLVGLLGLASVVRSEGATNLPAPSVAPVADTILEELDGFVPQYAGPNPSPALTSDSLALVQARTQVFVESEVVAFLRPDLSAGVVIEIVVVRADGWGGAFLGISAMVGEQADGFPASARLVVTEQSDDWFEVRSDIVEGVYGLRVTAFGSGDAAEATARSVLRTVTNAQYEALRQPDQIPALAGVNTESGRLALLTMEINAVLVGGALLAMSTALTDSAARLRLLRRRRRPKTEGPPPGVVDVRHDAQAALRRSRWRAAVSILATVCLVVTASALRLSVIASGVLVLAGIVAHGLVLQVLRLNPRPTGATHPHLRGWALVVGLPLVASSLALVFFGGSAVWVALAADVLGEVPNPDNLSVEEYQRLALIVGLVAIALSILPLILTRRLAAIRHAKKLADDDRTPTLFLRSFADDGIRMRSRSLGDLSPLDRLTLRRSERFEEIVARSVLSIGPIRALSDPGTSLPPLGAVRERVSDDAWRERIGQLIEESGLIVVSLARTQHCVDEIRDLRARGSLHKTLFVIAPVRPEERRKRIDVLAHTLDIAPQALDFESDDAVVLAIVVHPLFGIRVFTSDAPDDVSYQLVVRAAQAFVDSDWRSVAPTRASLNAAYTPIVWNGEPRVWGPGEAPRHRGWYRRLPGIVVGVTLLSLIVNSCVGLFPAYARGTPIPFDGRVQRVISDPTSNDVIALTFDGRLFRIDTIETTAESMADLGSPMTSLSTNGRWVAGVHSQDRSLVVVDSASARRWSIALDERPTDVTVVEDRVLVTFAQTDRLRSYDLGTGALLAEAAFPGTPWGVARADDESSVLVTLTERERVARVRIDDLAVLEEWGAPPSPRSILRSGDVWSIETSERAGIAEFDPAVGWHLLLTANQVYPVRPGGDSALASIDTGNGRDFELTALLPSRSDPCVLEFDSYSHSHVVTASGEIVVAFGDRWGVEVFDSDSCQ